MVLSYKKYIKYRKIRMTQSRSDREYTGFKDAECVIISMENKDIDNRELNMFGKLDDCYPVMLIRCPYDHLSSVWKVYEMDTKRTKEILDLWEKYAETFIKDDKLIKVVYDELCSNKKYLLGILEKIGIKNPVYDQEKKIIWQDSSFEDKKHARKIYNTLETCNYARDPRFTRMFEKRNHYNLWNTIRYLYIDS